MIAMVPKRSPLKSSNCADCGGRLRCPVLAEAEQVVRAVCEGDGCSYSVDLFWIGGPEGWRKEVPAENILRN